MALTENSRLIAICITAPAELSGDTVSSPQTTLKGVHPYRPGIEGYVDTDVLQDQPSQGIEVAMVDPEIVRQIRSFAALGWGRRRIAAELDIARKTVRRYVRGGVAAETQTRPAARALTDALRAEVVLIRDDGRG